MIDHEAGSAVCTLGTGNEKNCHASNGPSGTTFTLNAPQSSPGSPGVPLNERSTTAGRRVEDGRSDCRTISAAHTAVTPAAR